MRVLYLILPLFPSIFVQLYLLYIFDLQLLYPSVNKYARYPVGHPVRVSYLIPPLFPSIFVHLYLLYIFLFTVCILLYIFFYLQFVRSEDITTQMTVPSSFTLSVERQVEISSL